MPRVDLLAGGLVQHLAAPSAWEWLDSAKTYVVLAVFLEAQVPSRVLVGEALSHSDRDSTCSQEGQ